MGNLVMSFEERERLVVVRRVAGGELSVVKASELLGLSYRQAKRVCSRYRSLGDAGLVHGLRGRPSNRRVDVESRERVLSLYVEKYGDFGPTLASEYLEREDGLRVSAETLRRWLKSAGLWSSRRRRPAHRRWRARREHVGELVQMDGSHHDWFEGRRAWAVLMVMIDDATNRTYAQFFESETTSAAFETFHRYTERYGLPRALYVDRHSIYEPTREATVDENLAAEPPLTQFGRAMRELGVGLSLARSPQAKGRVERRNGVLQDRLVKALRMAGISELEPANEFLESEFLSELNARFTVAPRQAADLHRPVPRGVRLERVLSFQERRVVQNDWTVRWRNRWFQLTESNRRLSLVKRRVTVCEQLDGRVVLLYRGRELSWEELVERPVPRGRAGGAAGAGGVAVESGNGPGGSSKPSADHPWRRGFSRRQRERAGSEASSAAGVPRSAPAR